MGRPEKVKAGTFDTLIEAGGIRSASAIENDQGSYLLLVETGRGMPMLLHAPNGEPETFRDLNHLVAYFESRGIYRFEVIKNQERNHTDIDPEILSI